jgi:hypothetical protein
VAAPDGRSTEPAFLYGMAAAVESMDDMKPPVKPHKKSHETSFRSESGAFVACG